jgi:hypothetical protein
LLKTGTKIIRIKITITLGNYFKSTTGSFGKNNQDGIENIEFEKE